MKSIAARMTAVAAVIWILSGTDSRARSSPAREFCGTVAEINAKKQALTIRSAERSPPLTLAWTRDTKFIQSRRFTESTALKPGLRVCAYYRSPFFGKPFATKIVWDKVEQR